MTRPLHTIYNKRYSYLHMLADEYKKEGYGVQLNGFEGVLRVYEKGVDVPPIEKSQDQLEIERRLYEQRNVGRDENATA